MDSAWWVVVLKYFVYMVICRDGSIYTGYTSNLEQRIKQHNAGKKGAKYTRTRRPVTLSFFEIHNSQKEALQREREIKSWTRDKKLQLIEKFRKKQLKMG